MAWWMIAAALAAGGPVQQDMGTMPAMQTPRCPATAAPLPVELAGWSTMMPVRAAANADKATALSLGTGASVTLLPAAGVTYAAAMKHPGTPGSFGGNLAFLVTGAGRYRVALGSGAWIDVVQGGTALQTSVAHGRGPACTGVKKMVDFDLAPGAYLLQIAGNETATLGVMVARLPG